MGFFSCDKTTAADIRWLNRDHLSQVTLIDRAGFAGEPPWTYGHFAAILAGDAGAAMVAVRGDVVDGVVCYQFWSGHIRIDRLCVRPARRRAGVGTALVGRVADKLAVGFHTRLVIPTHERNAGAHAFLARLGFAATLRRGAEEGDPDTYVFTRGIGAAAGTGKGATR